MFDRDLFEKLCRRYGVQFSADYSEPMLRDGKDIHSVTADDVRQIIVPSSDYRIRYQLVLDYEPDFSFAA